MGMASANPVSVSEMNALLQVYPALWYVELIEIIKIWRALDDLCLKFWDEQAKAKEKKRQEGIPPP